MTPSNSAKNLLRGSKKCMCQDLKINPVCGVHECVTNEVTLKKQLIAKTSDQTGWATQFSV